MCAICGYGAAAFVPSLALERVLYYRELHDGCYAPATYYAAKFIEEGVLATVTSLLFCVIVHFGCALQGNFFVFAAPYYLTTMLGIILAYAVAALAPTMEAANAILPTMVTIWMYFGGLFLVFDKIPVSMIYQKDDGCCTSPHAYFVCSVLLSSLTIRPLHSSWAGAGFRGHPSSVICGRA